MERHGTQGPWRCDSTYFVLNFNNTIKIEVWCLSQIEYDVWIVTDWGMMFVIDWGMMFVIDWGHDVCHRLRLWCLSQIEVMMFVIDWGHDVCHRLRSWCLL